MCQSQRQCIKGVLEDHTGNGWEGGLRAVVVAISSGFRPIWPVIVVPYKIDSRKNKIRCRIG